MYLCTNSKMTSYNLVINMSDNVPTNKICRRAPLRDLSLSACERDLDTNDKV